MRRFPLVIFFSLGLFGFLDARTVQSQMLVAHRGASADAPENTLAAFRLAWKQDADAIEGDFYLTADDQIVAIHDRSTERTTGVVRDVCQSRCSDLQQLDAGGWKDQRFVGEGIPTLEQVVACIPKDKKLVLEIKDKPRIVPVLAEKLRTDPKLAALAPDRLMIISFQASVIKACKQQLPQVTAVWLTGFKRDQETGAMQPSIERILSTIKDCQADGLDCQASQHIDQEFVNQLRNARPDNPYQFHVWTVDDPEVARYFQRLGVDSITTNRPGELRQEIQQVGQ